MRTLASSALLSVLSACQPAAPTVPSSAPPAPVAERCPAFPLRLVIQAPQRDVLTVMTLDRQGLLRVATPQRPSLNAKLDGRGCVTGPDGLWAELTASGALWTPHESLRLNNGAIELALGRSMRIGRDGVIESVGADGNVEPASDGVIRIEGYREEARCASLLLLTTFMSAMPSMAEANGQPVMAAPDSVCGGAASDRRVIIPQTLVGVRFPALDSARVEPISLSTAVERKTTLMRSRRGSEEGKEAWFFHGFDRDRLYFFVGRLHLHCQRMLGCMEYLSDVVYAVQRSPKAERALGVETTVTLWNVGVNGIRGGMTAREVEAVLGKAQRVAAEQLVGSYAWEYPGLRVLFIDHRVAEVAPTPQ